MKPPSSFYRIIFPYAMRHHKLMIPDDFVKVHGNELSTTAKLTVPGGPIWDIGLKKSGRRLWFRDWWKEFSEHHTIHCWFFLLFEYEGNSKFNVHIFDLTASEINYYPRNHVNQNSVSDKGNSEGDDSVEILSSLVSEPPVISSPQKVSYEHVDKKSTGEANVNISAPRRKLDDGEAITKSEDLRATCQGKQRAYKVHHPERISFDRSEKKKRKGESKNIEDLHGHTKRIRGRAARHPIEGAVRVESATNNEDEQQTTANNMTTTGRKIAINGTMNFKPGNASFTVILQPYQIRSGPVHVPVPFIKRYLNISSDTTINLTLGGKQWKVVFIYSKGIHYLSRGWSTFAEDNKLSAGNTCVFDLIEVKNITFKVSIFRGGDSLSKNRPEFAPESSMRTKTHGSHFSSMERLRSERGNFTRSKRCKLDDGEEITKFENLTASRQGKQRAYEMPGTSRAISKSCLGKLTERAAEDGNYPIEGGKQPTVKNVEVELPGSKMSKSQLATTPERKIAIIDAMNFKQGNPSFTVFLRSYNIKSGPIVNVSVQFIRKYLNLSSDATILLTSGGRQWEVLLIYSNGTHCLSRGWSAFVKDNQLSVGNVCVFELVDVQNITFKVSISQGDDKQKDLENLRTEGTHRSGISRISLANPTERPATEVGQQERVKNEEEVEMLVTKMVKSELVTIPERKQAIEAAMMFKPRNPSFVVSLQPYNVKPKYIMNVPVAFIEKYLNISSMATTVRLAVGGRQWEAVLFHGKGAHCLRRGWSTFVEENQLLEGDVCVFELIQVNNIVLEVSTFRAG